MTALAGTAGFAEALRDAGVAVPAGGAAVFAEALALVGVADPDAVFWAGTATLTAGPDDAEPYAHTFRAYFGGAEPAGGRAPAPAGPAAVLTVATDGSSAPEPGETDQDGPDRDRPDDGGPPALRWSRRETLRDADLGACTDAERAEAERLLAVHRIHTGNRRARRRVPVAPTARRGRPDLARSVRGALRADGEILRLARRAPTTRPRPLVLLVDVSGSMAPYARALLRFAHAAVAAPGAPPVEVFAFGTRVTRLTRELRRRDPDAALAAAGAALSDWGGGTRLGESLRTFNDRWGAPGRARGAAVVILSDGWDRGDPAEVDAEMARLARLAHRVVWVNPLKASPGYEPLAAGMAAALPHVDRFVSGHSVASIEALASVLSGPPARRGRRA